MDYKDRQSLEQAYELILEGKAETPCPCTVGKKCKNPKCTCSKCKKEKAKMMKEGAETNKADGLSSPQIKDQFLLEKAYMSIYLKEQEGAAAVSQEELSNLYKQGNPLQFIKNTPVALATVEQLTKSIGEQKTQEVLKHAGAVDKTSYDEAYKNKGYVVFQKDSKTGGLDIYIAGPETVAQKYVKFEGALPTDDKSRNKIPSLLALRDLGIDEKRVPFFVKKVPTNMIKADEVGLANKAIQTSWGEQTVQQGGFLVREDNGHIYTVAPDAEGLPIGYIPA